VLSPRPVDPERLLSAADNAVELESALGTMRDADVAEALDALPPASAAHVLAALSASFGARLLSSGMLRRPASLVPFLSARFLAPRVDAMEPAARVSLLSSLAAHDRERLSPLLSTQTRTDLSRVLDERAERARRRRLVVVLTLVLVLAALGILRTVGAF
jgi:Mg/Co/Ni transporter MgtE